MSSLMNLVAQERQQMGTGSARADRRASLIPAVLYGAQADPLHITLEEKAVIRELNDPHHNTKLYEIAVGKTKHRAILREIQLHPVTDRPMHVDFLRINKESRITVSVPVEFINEDKSPGIKRGGVLNIVLHELHLTCAADHLPESLIVDLAGLEVGHSFHLESVTLPKGAQAMHAKGTTLATIVAPSGMKSEEADQPAETPAEQK